MAEVGVLGELTAAGIPIHCVAGTSAGAMVGAAYAAGRLPEFSAMLRALTRRRVLGLLDPVWRRGGLLEGRRSMDFLRPYFGDSIETLLRPFAAVATDLRSGDEVVLRKGSVIDAVRASIAIPGVFTPRAHEGRVLVDGGLVNPLPVSVARALGADFVIGVSVLPQRLELPGRSRRAAAKPLLARLLASAGARRAAARRVASRKKAVAESPELDLGVIEVILDATRIVERSIAAARLKEEPPDFLIEVRTARIGIFDFQLSDAMIEAGRAVARQVLPDLQKAITTRPLYRRLSRWRKAGRAKTP